MKDEVLYIVNILDREKISWRQSWIPNLMEVDLARTEIWSSLLRFLVKNSPKMFHVEEVFNSWVLLKKSL